MNVRKGVFPAAGLGTRFLPVTKPKAEDAAPTSSAPT
jgi:UTP-glucose-1-phosphate uridylyltransferase